MSPEGPEAPSLLCSLWPPGCAPGSHGHRGPTCLCSRRLWVSGGGTQGSSGSALSAPHPQGGLPWGLRCRGPLLQGSRGLLYPRGPQAQAFLPHSPHTCPRGSKRQLRRTEIGHHIPPGKPAPSRPPGFLGVQHPSWPESLGPPPTPSAQRTPAPPQVPTQRPGLGMNTDSRTALSAARAARAMNVRSRRDLSASESSLRFHPQTRKGPERVKALLKVTPLKMG